MLRWLTAGESHGQALVAVLEGLPAGVEVTTGDVADALARRRLGYGRGARMSFERDEVTFLGGVRHGSSIGSPLAVMIGNTEWPKWETVMAADPVDPEGVAVLRPQSLAGAMRERRDDRQGERALRDHHRAGGEQEAEAPDQGQEVAERDRDGGPHHRQDHGGVGGQPRQHLARAHVCVEAGIQRQDAVHLGHIDAPVRPARRRVRHAQALRQPAPARRAVGAER